MNQTTEKLTVLAADFGLPVQWFNFAGGWLLGCEYCTTAGHIVELYEKGKITREQHRELFLRVVHAKAQDDMKALVKLKGILRTGGLVARTSRP